MCSLRYRSVPAGTVEESTYLSGLDIVRVRRQCGVRVQMIAPPHVEIEGLEE